MADRLAADIAGGRLRSGDRLPPQREFARQQGIAGSTAARVYGELVRRGLVVGEVGRGTFVRSSPKAVDGRVDLELNFPVLPEQAAMLAPGLAGLLRPEALTAALQPVGPAGTPGAREAAAVLLSRIGWTPDPDGVLIAGSGRQALAAVMSALVPTGERLGVEAMTYPVVKSIASRLGITLVPLEIDKDGLVPDAVRAARPRAVYLQPTLHNPLGITMPSRRRTELAGVLGELDLVAIEDTVNGFLSAGNDDVPPLAAGAPDRVVLVDSLSKRIGPGLTLGFVVPPAALADRIGGALRSGAWTAGRFALEAATRWITDGTADAIQRRKRQDAIARQQLAAERLAGFTLRADPRAYHLWWELPEPWRAETFVAAAARSGIAVTPAAAFTVGSGRAPVAVRLALASPSPEVLSDALEVLAGIARGTPEDAGVE